MRFYKNKYHARSNKQSWNLFVFLTNLEICFCLHMFHIGINFNKMLFSIADNINIYEHIKSVYLVSNESFFKKEMVKFLNSILFVDKYYNTRALFT